MPRKYLLIIQVFKQNIKNRNFTEVPVFMFQR